MYAKVIRDNSGYPIEISSRDERLLIKVIGYIEPNNGRELLEVNVLFDGENINERIFPKSKKGLWNYIPLPVDRIVMASNNKAYYFIPTESSGVILDNRGFKLIEIPPYLVDPKKKYWRSRFVGNFFDRDVLVLMYLNQAVFVNLSNNEVKYGLPNNEWTIFDGGVDDKSVFFRSYKILTGQRVESMISMLDLTLVVPKTF